MRHILLVPKASLCPAAAVACAAGMVSSSLTPTTTLAAFTWAARWQSQSRPSGGGAGDRRGGSRSSGAKLAPTTASRAEGWVNPVMNSTKDGELSFGTRVAMRDDTVILTDIFKHVPQQGAISIKSLFSALNEDVQEALCEKHGGLHNFLEQRKQIFIVRPHPTDGVLYVVGNPLVAQQYATRELQRKTMQHMMGLDDEASSQQQQRRPGSNFGSRGGGGNYNRNHNRRDNNNNSGDRRVDGQGQGRYQGKNGSSRNSSGGGRGGDAYGGNDRRRPPPSREDRRPFGGGSRSNNSSNHYSGPPPPRERGPMGSRQQSFGTRS